ncbi:MAG: hypothetical protein ISP01_05455 [Methanobrevibacter arboriphilus]|uniref:Uncharacterized protein n=2 Tax=Methanobrevibacter arboriphilus TaxID=39441 RepID=A0A843AIE6_METAZ|nr:hypothetical protein [Methanobrevibacter arboriphilus]
MSEILIKKLKSIVEDSDGDYIVFKELMLSEFSLIDRLRILISLIRS